MNKRSAIVTAGGLAASFMAGVAAVAFNWGLGTTTSSPAAAAGPPGTKATKPRVRHRTIVIHRKAPGPAPSRTVTLPAPSRNTSAPVATTGGSAAAAGEGDDSSSEHDD